MRKIIVVIAVLAALGIIGWLYWRQSRPVPLVVSGFIEADEVRVGSRIGGRVAEVMASEGQRVQPGQPLYRLDPFDLQETLAQTQAELAAYQAEHARLTAGYRKEEIEQARAKRERAAAVLEKLIAGPRKREIEIARERLNAAKANLERATSEHDRVIRLAKEAQAAPAEVDEAVRALKASRAEAAAAEQELALLEEGSRKEDIAEAKAALAEAEQALKLVEGGYRVEDIARAAAQVAAAQAQVAAMKVRMNELTITSPCDCVVEAIDLRPGDLVASNAPSVSLLELGRLWVRAYVPEARLGQVMLGQYVPIRVDGFPNERFTGRVTFVAREGEFTPRNIQTPEERSKQVFRIKVTLTQAGWPPANAATAGGPAGKGLERLRVGMAADVLLDEAIGP